MQRLEKTYDFDAYRLRYSLLEVFSDESHLVLLDSNENRPFSWQQKLDGAEAVLAVGAVDALSTSGNSLSQLQHFYSAHKDWCFGHLSYQLKNEIFRLGAPKEAHVSAPHLAFFIPKVVLALYKDKVQAYLHPEASVEWIDKHIQEAQSLLVEDSSTAPSIFFSSGVDFEDYKGNFDHIKKHIQRGDVYEVNYCMEFSADVHLEAPASTFETLNENLKAPFSAYYKSEDLHLMSCSPERFLAVKGSELISQPIKGTAKRGSDNREDEQIVEKLKSSAKERAENAMIVDLVRNDLSHYAVPGTVQVEELYGVYSFSTVHQLVSTVKAELKEDTTIASVLEKAFPMGSMTGAPKYSALKIIDTYENFSRTLYSGSVGYIDPNGDCDFNVVIRSLLYDKKRDRVSLGVGSAITDLSVAEEEYSECLLKAERIFELLKG